ncbi:hypothetical protein SAMN04488120_10693 [Fontimonas thermophila]|uniref:Divergent polysaccharide deacetylase n=1 Tax=Fontimonas thermophila TaxID=1076937 RepID=A0A1I2JEK3_9GAMM|nr:divergent polysaccharide deacetylase family protein [Fontimonas thermophila]SFF51296.1 hypothetical protein SAMN04488120_10693 [Fontimonas thermophila]
MSRLWPLAAALAILLGGLMPAAAAAQRPWISIIVDDLGDNWDEGRAAVALPGPVACAFLPESPHTRRLAESAFRAGKEILVHLPLEPLAGRAHPLALSAQPPYAANSAQLARLLASVPHAVGVNNHQGSRATANRSAMHWLMRELSRRGSGYFVDSMTTADSVAYPLARAYGIPATRRRVFLDHDRGIEPIRAQFQRLIAIARQQGGALAIAHPYHETYAVLTEMLPRLSALGVELVPPSQLIRRTEQRLLVQPVMLRMSTALTLPIPSLPAADLSAAATR